MTWSLGVLCSLGLVLGSVSAIPRSFLDSAETQIVQQVASLPRDKLLRIIINFLEDDDLEKMGIKNMGELSETEAKRAPFSSWGGKRADMADMERGMYRYRRGGSSFSAWGGKRNDLVDYIKAHLAARSRRGDDSPIKVIRPARAAFSAWGGK